MIKFNTAVTMVNFTTFCRALSPRSAISLSLEVSQPSTEKSGIARTVLPRIFNLSMCVGIFSWFAEWLKIFFSIRPLVTPAVRRGSLVADCFGEGSLVPNTLGPNPQGQVSSHRKSNIVHRPSNIDGTIAYTGCICCDCGKYRRSRHRFSLAF